MKAKHALEILQFKFSLRRNYIRLLCELILFTVYILFVLGHNSVPNTFAAQKGLENTFFTPGSDLINEYSTMKYLNIPKQDEIYTWIDQTLLPATYPIEKEEEKTTTRTATYHKTLGAIRLKKIYREPVKCHVDTHLDQIVDNCYSGEQKSELSWIPTVLDLKTIRQLLSLSNAKEFFQTPGMEVLEISIPYYNAPHQVYTLVRFNLHLTLGGLIEPKYEILSIPIKAYPNAGTVICDVLVGILWCLLLYRELRDLKRTHWKTVLSDPWHVLNLLIFCLITVSIVLWIVVYSALNKTDQLFENIEAVLNQIFDEDGLDEASYDTVNASIKHLNSIFVQMYYFRLISCITCVALSFRILNCCRFQPRLAVLTKTLDSVVQESGSFFIVFVVMLLAYVVGGYVLFGGQIKEFSSFTRSFVTCFYILFGQFDLNESKDHYYWKTMVWYGTYMVVLFLILFNMFLAIVLESFNKMKIVGADTNRRLIQEIRTVLIDLMLDGFQKTPRWRVSNACLKAVLETEVEDMEMHISVKYICKQFHTTEQIAMATLDELQKRPLTLKIPRSSSKDDSDQYSCYYLTSSPKPQ